MSMKNRIKQGFADLKSDFKTRKRDDKIISLIPAIGLLSLFPSLYTREERARIPNSIVTITAHLIYIFLIIWYVQYKNKQATLETDLKEAADLQFFMKHATEQNIADFNKLKELREQKKTFRNNAYFYKLLKEQEEGYKMAMDSMRYMNGVSK